MILSNPDIRRALQEGFRVDPTPEAIDQVSINLHIGDTFLTFKELPPHLPVIRVRDSLFEEPDKWWETTRQKTYRLEPGGFVLAQTLERIVMPGHLMGLIEGRSSWARAGVGVHLTAPKIDPGFSGTITLEMTNLGKAPIELVAEEDAPAQLILAELKTPLDESEIYGARPEDRFQNQTTPLPPPRQS